MSEHPFHLAGNTLSDEDMRRLDALAPVLREVASEDGLKLFLAALTLPTLF